MKHLKNAFSNNTKVTHEDWEKAVREAHQKDCEDLRHDFYHRMRAYCCTMIGCCEIWELCKDPIEKEQLRQALRQTVSKMLDFVDMKIAELEGDEPACKENEQNPESGNG